MMYEYGGGMGWSDIRDYPSCPNIPGGGTKRCIIPGRDEPVAQYNGCVRLGGSCTTTGGIRGEEWCCPPFPMQDIPPGGTGTRSLVCNMESTPRVSMRTDAQRAMWDVQNALCQRGLDPGPISGQRGSQMLIPALEAAQANMGIPQTGQFDAVTLRGLGFSATQATAMARLLTGPASFADQFRTNQSGLLPILIGGSVIAAGLVVFGVHQLTKKKKRRLHAA